MEKVLWNELSDGQSEKIVGGVGLGTTGGNSAGFNGWGVAGPSAGHGLGNAPGQAFAPTTIDHNGTSVVHPM